MRKIEQTAHEIFVESVAGALSSRLVNHEELKEIAAQSFQAAKIWWDVKVGQDIDRVSEQRIPSRGTKLGSK